MIKIFYALSASDDKVTFIWGHMTNISPSVVALLENKISVTDRPPRRTDRNDGDNQVNNTQPLRSIAINISPPVIQSVSEQSVLNQPTDISHTIVTPQLIPYQYHPKISPRDQFIMCLMIPILPIKVVGIFTTIMISYFVARVTIFCTKIPPEEYTRTGPLSGWQYWCQRFMRKMARVMFFFIGMHRVKIVGDKKQLRAGSQEAPVIIASPHLAYTDCFLSAVVECSPVARAEVRDMPIFGLCTTILQPIYVDRENETSRQSTAAIIERRCKDEIGRWPPVLIFPEATTSNGTCLYKFKAGAFIPGKPVQMVTIQYRTWMKSFNPMIMTWDMGKPTWKVIARILLQPKITAVVENLGIYKPSIAESGNARLYAANMQEKMANMLKLPKTDFTYKDAKDFMDAGSSNANKPVKN